MAISDLPEGDLTAAASVPAEGVNEAKPRRVSVTKLATLLHGLVQPEASPEPAGLHVGVSDGFAESRAGSVAGQDVVVMLHPMSAAVSVPPVTPALSWVAPDTATAGVAITGTLTASGAATGPWSLNVPAGWTVSPSSGSSVVPGSPVSVSIIGTEGTQSLSVTCAGATITGNPQSIVVSAAGGSIPTQTPFRLLRGGVQIGTYKYITDAFAAAATGTPNNDTIKVTGGNYIFTAGNSVDWVVYALTGYGARSPLTIEAEDLNNPPVFDWSAAIESAGAAITPGIRMEPGCLSLTLRGLRFIGYQLAYADSNAGVYTLADYPAFTAPATLTVDRCLFDRWTNGIITSSDGENLAVTIRRSVFKDCLGGDARTHGIYIGRADSLTVEGCAFKTTADNLVTDLSLSGHLLKSRARVNVIRGNYFDPATGCLCSLDISNGGECEITGNVILHYGTGTSGVAENPAVKYGAEQRAGQPFAPNNTVHTLLFGQNTVRKNQISTTTLWNPLKVYDDMIDELGDPVTATTTVRNNIVAGPYASLFTADWPDNTAAALGAVADDGTYSGGTVAGSPALNDATLAYAGEYAEPAARTDTDRGGILGGFGALSTAVAGMAAGDWLNWTGSTNVVAITDTSGPDATAVGWLEGDNTGRIFTNWPGNATWDVARKRVLLVGCTNGYSSESPAGAHSAMVALDVTTGNFSKTWNPYSVNIGHQYDGNSSIVLGGYLYRASYADTLLRRLDLATGVWSTVVDWSVSPISISAGQCNALAIHPNMGTAGSVLMFGPGGKVGRWDVGTSTASQICASQTGVGGAGAESGVAEYHEGIDSIVFGGGQGGSRLYTINASAAVALLTSSFPAGVAEISPRDVVSTTLAPDPQGRAYAWLFDKLQTGKVWRLNLSTAAWTDMGSIPAPIIGATCYATLPHLGVHAALDSFGRVNSTTADARVYIFKPS